MSTEKIVTPTKLEATVRLPQNASLPFKTCMMAALKHARAISMATASIMPLTSCPNLAVLPQLYQNPPVSIALTEIPLQATLFSKTPAL